MDRPPNRRSFSANKATFGSPSDKRNYPDTIVPSLTPKSAAHSKPAAKQSTWIFCVGCAIISQGLLVIVMLLIQTGRIHIMWSGSKPEVLNLVPRNQNQRSMEKFNISIYVIAFSRPKSLKTLLSQIKVSNLEFEHVNPLNLYIRVPKNDRETWDTAHEFNWNLGSKLVSSHNTSRGARTLWTDIFPKRPEEVIIILEDDLRLSPFFLDWTIHLLQHYGGPARDPNLMGFSLAPLLWDEVSLESGPWDASERIGRVGTGAQAGPAALYLHMLPATWGGVFFADRWLEFQRYAIRRALYPFNTSAEGLPPADDPPPHPARLPHQRLAARVLGPAPRRVLPGPGRLHPLHPAPGWLRHGRAAAPRGPARGLEHAPARLRHRRARAPRRPRPGPPPPRRPAAREPGGVRPAAPRAAAGGGGAAALRPVGPAGVAARAGGGRDGLDGVAAVAPAQPVRRAGARLARPDRQRARAAAARGRPGRGAVPDLPGARAAPVLRRALLFPPSSFKIFFWRGCGAVAEGGRGARQVRSPPWAASSSGPRAPGRVQAPGPAEQSALNFAGRVGAGGSGPAGGSRPHRGELQPRQSNPRNRSSWTPDRQSWPRVLAAARAEAVQTRTRSESLIVAPSRAVRKQAAAARRRHAPTWSSAGCG